MLNRDGNSQAAETLATLATLTGERECDTWAKPMAIIDLPPDMK